METGVALSAARRDIAQRLRTVCDYCTDTEFDALVERIARIEIKYRMRDMFNMLLDAEAVAGASRAHGLR